MLMMNLRNLNKDVYFIVRIISILTIAASCVPGQVKNSKYETGPRTKISAFLAGAILGDNVAWIAHGITGRRVLSISKQMMFQNTLHDLRIPRESENSVLLLLQKSMDASKKNDLQSAQQLNVEAISKTEDSVKSIYGQLIVYVMRFGMVTMMAVELARMAEIGFESHQERMAQMIINTHLKNSVNILEKVSQNLNLSREARSYVSSVGNYFKKDKISVREVISIQRELEKILRIYELQPLTEMQLHGDRIHLEDTILELTIDERVPHLITKLKSDDEKIKNQAIAELTKIGGPGVKALITELKMQTIPGKGVPLEGVAYSMEIATILGKIGEASLFPLMSVMEHSRDGNTRLNAALALGFLGDRRAITALEKVSREDPDSAVRLAAELARDTMLKKK